MCVCVCVVCVCVCEVRATIYWVNATELTALDLLSTLPKAHGILLTGGADVHPGRYGQPQDTISCGAIDEERDSLESMLLQWVDRTHLPCLGICRGMQFMTPKGLKSTGSPEFCTIWTYMGLPSISLPLLVGENNLPLGVQLIGDKLDDLRFLGVANWLEKNCKKYAK